MISKGKIYLAFFLIGITQYVTLFVMSNELLRTLIIFLVSYIFIKFIFPNKFSNIDIYYTLKDDWQYSVIGSIIFIMIFYTTLGISMFGVDNYLNFIRNLFTNTSYLLPAIKTVFIHPIQEEMLFRFLFLSSLMIIMSKKKALIISSVLFGAMHLIHHDNYTVISMAFRFLSTAFGGFIFGYAYIKNKSIFSAINWHIYVNLPSPFFDYWRDIGLLSTPYYFKYIN